MSCLQNKTRSLKMLYIKQISCGTIFSGEEQNFQKKCSGDQIFTENFVPPEQISPERNSSDSSILRCIKFQSYVSFAQALSTLPCYSFEQSTFNGESNNLNWEPVDNMVPKLWRSFYRHTRRKFYWACLYVYISQMPTPLLCTPSGT